MKKILFMAIAAIVCVPCAHAEKVYLTNGQVIQGKIALEETGSVIVQTGDNKYKTILRSDIEAIKPDNAAPDAVFDSDGTPARKKKTLKMLGDEVSIEGSETIVRIGTDAGGIMDISVRAVTQNGYWGEGSGNEDIAKGMFIGAERYYFTSPLTGMGFGLVYDFPRTMRDYDEASFNYLNAYGAIKMRYFLKGKRTNVFAVGKAGYGMLFANSGFKDGFGPDAKTSGGIYYGFGGGVQYDRFMFELLFSTNHGRTKIENYYDAYYGNIDFDYTFTYKRTCVSVGYVF